MSELSHILTSEDIAQVKAMVAEAAAQAKRPTPPVMKKSFKLGDCQFDFLYTWLEQETYARVMGAKGYQEAAKTNPVEAERYMESVVLSECILWPPSFSPGNPASTSIYPAGVLPELMTAVMRLSGSDASVTAEVFLDEVTVPEFPSDAEREALRAAHPIARHFARTRGKTFYAMEFDAIAQTQRAVPMARYLYTVLDRATHVQAMKETSEEAMVDFVIKACTLWPTALDWDAQPAFYRSWLFQSIMAFSGFGQFDPSDVADEVV